MGEKLKGSKSTHFSTNFVERAGTKLIEKKVLYGRRIGGFSSTSVAFEKTNSEIEKDFRAAFERIRISK